MASDCVTIRRVARSPQAFACTSARSSQSVASASRPSDATDQAEPPHGLGEAGLVAELRERLDRLLVDRPRLVEVERPGPEELRPGAQAARVRREAPLSERGRPLVQLLVDRPRSRDSPRLVERVAVGQHQLEPLEAVGGQERGGAAEQVRAGVDVAAVVGAPAGGAEVAAGARGEGAGVVVERAELGAVAVGLLEVVAEDLVVLADALAGDAARASRRSARAASARSFFAVAR